ncbi:hypothetical protein [Streptomyces sp. NPDC002671]
MSDSDLVELLVAHTGDLQPAPDTPAGDLTELRRALAYSARDCLTTDARARPVMDDADDTLRAELRRLVAAQVEEEAASPPARLLSRASPAADDRSLPSWAVALRPDRTFGPFVDGLGRPVWYDLFRPRRWFDVRLGDRGPVALALPPGAFGEVQPGEGQLSRIPPGTVWLAARSLTASAPDDGWAGLRVTGGTMRVGQPERLLEDALIVPQDAIVHLTLDLDPPLDPGPRTGPGAAAAQAVPGFPKTVFIDLDPVAPTVVRTADASLSLYGTDFALHCDDGAPAYDPDLGQILVPLAATPDRLAPGASHADLFTPSGTGHITRAAWALPVTTGPHDALAEAAGTGCLVLSVADGLRANWQGLVGGPLDCTATDILVDGTSLRFIAHRAAGRGARQTFQLWQEAPGVRSSLDIAVHDEFRLVFTSHRVAQDGLWADGTALAHLDQPRTADGSRVDFRADVHYRLRHAPGGVDLSLDSADLPPRGRTALALENALLCVTRPLHLSLTGPLTGPDQLESGDLAFDFGLHQLLPTLPDPYAANFTPALDRSEPVGLPRVATHVTWSEPAEARLTFDLGADPAQVYALLPPPSRAEWSGRRGEPFVGLTMLDVSSNADQLGLFLHLSADSQEQTPLAVDDLTLTARGSAAWVFLLPQFQWEPVRNTSNDLTGDIEGRLVSGTDGTPTLIGAQSVRLVPVTANHVAEEVARAHQEDSVPAGALFTLPFGIVARAQLNPRDGDYLAAPGLEILRARFDGLRGARQVSLRAGVRADAERVDLFPHIPMLRRRPFLPGWAQQTENTTFLPAGFPPNPPDLTSVLGELRGEFNSAFQEEVPLTRIDFGGYGANTISRWVNDSPSAVQVSQVAFDAFHGRTAYERVQLTTLLWPCQATLVRTITLERHGSASVVRSDSGWVATTPGLFRHPKAPGRTFHPGVVRGMYDIREIRDTDHHILLDPDAGAPAADMQAVYFDADIEVDGVQRGQGAGRRVPAHRQLGFVQRIKISEQVSSGGVGAVTAGQLSQLFDLQGPLGGPVDCTIRIGSSPYEMRVSGIYADNAGGSPPEFAVAAFGSPVLPGPGQWSVVRVHGSTGPVEPVDAQLGVPLIRQGTAAAGLSASPYPFRWADPAHLTESEPDLHYALLFANDTQRILYEHPRITAADTDITSGVEPLLADPYSLLRSGGLFPPPQNAIKFDRTYPLSLASGALRFVPGTVSFPAASERKQQLVNAGSWTAYALYQGGHTGFEIASDDGWKIGLARVRQLLRFEPLGEILALVHDIHSPTTGPTAFPDLGIEVQGPLQPVADVLQLLSALAPSPEGDLGPLHVSACRDGTGFRLSALADFAVEGEQGEAVDCGMGKLRGHLKVGAELAADLLAAKVGGAVFLEITGEYQQEVFPGIYGGGRLRFLVRADDTGKSAVELDACTAGSVGGTIVPGLVDLEAGVKYGYFVGLDGTFQPGIVLGMEGRAKLLSGLLGFSLTVEGRLIVQRVQLDDPRVTLRGDILVAGTVTAAWLVKKRKSFHASFDVTVTWQMVLGAAKAGLIPVPP